MGQPAPPRIRQHGQHRYYEQMAGRWFTAPGRPLDLSVAANALPGDFARIPPGSRAAVVLPTVAGTPQAQEAVIENTIPQTATVKRVNGPQLIPTFDGAPQWSPVPGTALSYVSNASAPLIQVPGGQMYAVQAGVWFTAPVSRGRGRWPRRCTRSTPSRRGHRSTT
ncbi:MAG: hypothetical protein IPH64_03880 [Comamonadaceae bacterium]|nr:hypothetical protein [Comamonadaceae bacterium]